MSAWVNCRRVISNDENTPLLSPNVNAAMDLSRSQLEWLTFAQQAAQSVCVSMLSEETRVRAFSAWDKRRAGWNIHSAWKLLYANTDDFLFWQLAFVPTMAFCSAFCLGALGVQVCRRMTENDSITANRRRQTAVSLRRYWTTTNGLSSACAGWRLFAWMFSVMKDNMHHYKGKASWSVLQCAVLSHALAACISSPHICSCTVMLLEMLNPY